MTIEKVIVEAYRSGDSTFLTKEDAENHANEKRYVQYFSVNGFPDLNEGSGTFYKKGYIGVCARSDHSSFAIHACYELFGSKFTFIQGSFSANCIVESWNMKPFDGTPTELLATVQDSNCPLQVWETGVIIKDNGIIKEVSRRFR